MNQFHILKPYFLMKLLHKTMNQLLGPISAALINKAIQEELTKQQRFQVFRKLIGAMDHSLSDPKILKVSFYDPRGTLVAFANKQVLGCWDSRTKEWQWAWSLNNESLDYSMKQDAKRLFFVGARNRWPLFVTPKFKASSHLLRVICALSVNQVGAWTCASYKSGSKHWFVLVKDLNYLDPMVRMSVDHQMRLALGSVDDSEPRRRRRRSSSRTRSSSRSSSRSVVSRSRTRTSATRKRRVVKRKAASSTARRRVVRSRSPVRRRVVRRV